LRYFSSLGLDVLCSQSYSKNIGLYGERIGTFSIVTPSPEIATRITSQLKIIVRQLYSNPPLFGARIVHLVLSDPDLKREWYDCLKVMSGRIMRMRELLRHSLEEKGTPGTWDHITNQIGMFSYLGIKKEQAQKLVNNYHIYMLDSGRISMAGLNEHVMEYFVESLHSVLTEDN